jgi:hypothetical protein
MSTITGQTIATKVQKLLHDETAVRWTEAELVGWINSAQKEIVLYKPNSITSTLDYQLDPGTFQNVSAKAGFANVIQLLDVIRSTTGGANGKAVTNISREILDSTLPDWHSVTATAVPLHYIHNPLDPKNFYVYPPNTGAGSVQILVAVEPTDLVALASNLSLDSIYESVVLDYVLYRAFSKDTEHTANMQRSAGHYNAFMSALKGKFQMENALSADAQYAPSKQPQPQG